MSRPDRFARIARRYDRINSILSLGHDHAWRASVLERLPQGRLLDLGAGTGALLRQARDHWVVAVDPSGEMLAFNQAARRVVAVGEKLPFAAGSFDAVLAAFVMRNLDSIEATLSEVARVLRPGGAFGVVDLGRPRGRWAGIVHRAGTLVTLPTVGLLGGAPREYAYLHRSLDSLPPPEDLYAGRMLRLEAVWRMGWMGFVHGVVLRRED